MNERTRSSSTVVRIALPRCPFEKCAIRAVKIESHVERDQQLHLPRCRNRGCSATQ